MFGPLRQVQELGVHVLLDEKVEGLVERTLIGTCDELRPVGERCGDQLDCSP